MTAKKMIIKDDTDPACTTTTDIVRRENQVTTRSCLACGEVFKKTQYIEGKPADQNFLCTKCRPMLATQAKPKRNNPLANKYCPFYKAVCKNCGLFQRSCVYFENHIYRLMTLTDRKKYQASKKKFGG